MLVTSMARESKHEASIDSDAINLISVIGSHGDGRSPFEPSCWHHQPGGSQHHPGDLAPAVGCHGEFLPSDGLADPALRVAKIPS